MPRRCRLHTCSPPAAAAALGTPARPPACLQSVQTFGRKKNAVAVAYVKRGKGEIRLNGEARRLRQGAAHA